MVGPGEPMQVEGANLAADLLPMLGIAPAMGRWFTADDERRAAPGVVILGYGLWESRFGGRMDAIGEKILLDGDAHTIIGVMPPEFSFPQRAAQLWRPLRFAPADLADRRNIYLSAIARRKPGVSLEQAREEMRLISARLATQYPKENSPLSATVTNLRDQVSLQSRTLVMALLAASACVLLIACTNLANLLLARALSRQKELSVRASLGAGRERLVWQPLTEIRLRAGVRSTSHLARLPRRGLRVARGLSLGRGRKERETALGAGGRGGFIVGGAADYIRPVDSGAVAAACDRSGISASRSADAAHSAADSEV